MADLKKDFTNKGNITCNKNILLSIINLATKEISGIASLSNKFKCAFKRIFSKKDFNGVKINFDTNGNLCVDIYVNVYNGVSIPDIAYKVQENVKNNVASMVDMKVTKVNVYIVDVEFKEEVII